MSSKLFKFKFCITLPVYHLEAVSNKLYNNIEMNTVHGMLLLNDC